MRHRLRAAAALLGPALAALALAACAAPAVDTFQAAPAGLAGRAFVRQVEVVPGPRFKRQAAEADARLEPGDPTTARLIEQAVAEAARARGLTGERPLRLVLEMDALAMPGTARSALGAGDRLAGQVRVLDARSEERLAEFYVDVDRSYPGLIGQLARGGGVRERLTQAFAARVAEQLVDPTRRARR
ncbi:MAG: hypothetical protein ACJ8DZ_02510 [Allosphingosinicella sp.]